LVGCVVEDGFDVGVGVGVGVVGLVNVCFLQTYDICLEIKSSLCGGLPAQVVVFCVQGIDISANDAQMWCVS